MTIFNVQQTGTGGVVWNGPVCGTCDKPYLNTHRCDPEALVAKAERLMELAAREFDRRLAEAEPA